MENTHGAWGTSAEDLVLEQLGEDGVRFAPHEGHIPRPLQEKATRSSLEQVVHLTRAKPDSNGAQSRYLVTALS